MEVSLRDLVDDDIPILFEFQFDPEASAMAAFPSRDEQAHREHTEKIRKDPTTHLQVIEADGHVAGSLVCWESEGGPEVGYWIGKSYWSRGIASRALAMFLELEDRRPLQAHVALHNKGSIKVLQRSGFEVVEERTGADGVAEYHMRLT